MDPASIISYIQLGYQGYTVVKEILDSSTSNGDIASKLKSSLGSAAPLIESLGAILFPKAAKEIHIVAGAIAAFDPNTTKWIQGALNNLVTPSPKLKVDGVYGKLTTAAVEQFQTQNNLKIDGVAGEITKAAITFALSHPVQLTK